MLTSLLHNILSAQFPSYPLSIIALEELAEITESLFFRKNEIVSPEGKIANKIFLLASGNLVGYSTPNGIKQVARFWFSNQPLVLLPSLLDNQPTPNTILALNDCTVLTIHFGKLTSLAKQNLQLAEIINLLLTWETMLLRDYIELLKKEPIQRFTYFMQKHPDLIQVATADLIASYLNMGYSTFARYRQTKL